MSVNNPDVTVLGAGIVGICTAYFIQKSGFQQFASKNKIAVIVPDTSPRGENIPDDENHKLGCGAGFYLNATQEPWSQNYNMYDYITKELPDIIANNYKFSNKLQIKLCNKYFIM